GVFREFAPGHQRPFALRELPVAGGAAQPFNVLVLARPGAMANVAGVGPIELLTIWIGARKCRISFVSWRHRYHGDPPLIGNGPKDTDSTPVVPCYYSPGLPGIEWLCTKSL